MPELCPSCDRFPDWRGWHNAHLVNKGMGGNPKGKRKETVRVCARCHSEMHGLREVESQPMWSKGAALRCN